MSDPTPANKETEKRSRTIKTLLFVVAMAAILGIFSLASLIDRPLDMPQNADHVAPVGNPNPYCKQCHPADSLPKTHPKKVERAECTRCHRQTQEAPPPSLRKDAGMAKQP